MPTPVEGIYILHGMLTGNHIHSLNGHAMPTLRSIITERIIL